MNEQTRNRDFDGVSWVGWLWLCRMKAVECVVYPKQRSTSCCITVILDQSSDDKIANRRILTIRIKIGSKL